LGERPKGEMEKKVKGEAERERFIGHLNFIIANNSIQVKMDNNL